MSSGNPIAAKLMFITNSVDFNFTIYKTSRRHNYELETMGLFITSPLPA